MNIVNKFLNSFTVYAQDAKVNLGFTIPSLGQLLTFIIRVFFLIAGLTALFFLLTGALQWITSGGSKENVDKARERIQQALIGVILIVVVLTVVMLFEQVIFGGKICFGISCEIKFSELKLIQ